MHIFLHLCDLNDENDMIFYGVYHWSTISYDDPVTRFRMSRCCGFDWGSLNVVDLQQHFGRNNVPFLKRLFVSNYADWVQIVLL